MTDFKQLFKKMKSTHWKFFSVLTIAYFTIWILKNFKIPNEGIISNSAIVLTLEYIIMIGAGFAIWYGYYTYDKTAQLLKPKDNMDEKQSNYVVAKKFQTKLIFAAYITSILAFAFTSKDQFAFTAFICMLFAAISVPSFTKFKSDFTEMSDDDDFESEINPNLQNDIKQNFESEL